MARAAQSILLGLDMGGTSLKSGLVRPTGKRLTFHDHPVDARGGKAAIKAALTIATDELLDEARRRGLAPVAIGLGFPGTVGGRAGVVFTEPPQIPGVEGMRLGALLAGRAGVPATVENDATAATLAEARHGAGRGKANVLMVTIGTGVGGGLVIDGRLVRGRYGTGGEIGHAILYPEGERCRCGGRGCMELYSSATALGRIYRRRRGRKTSSVRDIVDLARDGNRTARAAMNELGTNLGRALASAATVVAPDVILVGGGLSAADDLLLDPTRAAFEAQVFPYLRRTPIKLARLGNEAGIVGAALAAGEAAALASDASRP